MTMTDDRMALIELVEKQADVDLVREMLAFAAERIMEVEVEARTGAAKGSRSPRCARFSGTDTAIGLGTPAPAGSRWSFRSCGREAIFPAFSSRDGRPRRRSWR